MVYVSGGNQLINRKKIFERVGVGEGMHLADLGSGGLGYFVLPAAKMVGEKGKVYAVDVLKSALSEVSKRARFLGLNNVKPIWANLEIYSSTGIPDCSLDIVFLINMLFQSKEHSTIFQEAKRILKLQGKLLVIDWNQTAIPFGPKLEDRVQTQEIKTLATSLGLRLLDEFSPGKFHYALLFQRET